MPHSLARVVVHIVFGTKNGEPLLGDESIRDELYAYIASVLAERVDSPAIRINGVEDHLHIMCSLSRKFALKDVVKECKTESTKWLKKRSPDLQSFHWQSGYGVFSVSESEIQRVKRYIDMQKKHHERFSFREEFRELCKRHGLNVDERYQWE